MAGVNGSAEGTETQRAGTSQTTKLAAAVTRIDIVLEFKPAPPTWIARTLWNPHPQHNPKSPWITDHFPLVPCVLDCGCALPLSHRSPNPAPRRSPALMRLHCVPTYYSDYFPLALPTSSLNKTPRQIINHRSSILNPH